MKTKDYSHWVCSGFVKPNARNQFDRQKQIEAYVYPAFQKALIYINAQTGHVFEFYKVNTDNDFREAIEIMTKDNPTACICNI